MRVAMIGSGYVGLVSGACFAEFGAEVTCIDHDKAKIENLKALRMPIYEPGLDSLVSRNLLEGRLVFSSHIEKGVKEADLVFIAVGTPSRRGDGAADLAFIYEAATQIAKNLDGYTVVVDKSTVPVGTARKVSQLIAETNATADFDIASNPEFLREGAAISDFMRPDRVVLGVESDRAKALLTELYRPLNLRETPILVTDLESAELIKYASNAFLATKISFINEISSLCESVNADVHAIAKGMGMDARIGPKFLHPGPGYGGSCFPKDTRALLNTALEYGNELKIVSATVEANAAHQEKMVAKIRQAVGGSEAGKTVAVLGLTFKPETDDIRESPAIKILPQLVQGGANIVAHDPKGLEAAKCLLPQEMIYCADLDNVFQAADAIVILTEWNVYRALNFEKIISQMRGRAFIDLRNIYEREAVEKAGFHYHCVGR